jgi:hypothetical protein
LSKMGRLTNRLRISFHIAKLGLSMLLAYAVLKWRVRQATGSFREELLNEGLPREVANTLADSYRQSNKKILGLVDSGLASLSSGRASKDFEG